MTFERFKEIMLSAGVREFVECEGKQVDLIQALWELRRENGVLDDNDLDEDEVYIGAVEAIEQQPRLKRD